MTDIDANTRLTVIRDICRKEGHGDLIETMDLDDLPAFLERRRLTGTVRLRGKIEIEP